LIGGRIARRNLRDEIGRSSPPQCPKDKGEQACRERMVEKGYIGNNSNVK
jgi:hypothetical protein